jgi:AcrR family transcriptional regulator
MEDRLKAMDPQKKERLLQSAYQEFGENRFDKASTNVIVRNAQISKGLLYYYFGSKKELYLYLCESAFKMMAKEIEERVDWDKSDLFERIKAIAIVKFQMGEKYPYILPFFTSIYADQKIMETNGIIQQYYGDLYKRVYAQNIDYQLFKPGTDVEKAISIVRWTIEKYGEETQAKEMMTESPTDYGEMILGIDVYLKMLRSAFYKEERGENL